MVGSGRRREVQVDLTDFLLLRLGEEVALPGRAGSETHSADDSVESSTPQASLEQFV